MLIFSITRVVQARRFVIAMEVSLMNVVYVEEVVLFMSVVAQIFQMERVIVMVM